MYQINNIVTRSFSVIVSIILITVVFLTIAVIAIVIVAVITESISILICFSIPFDSAKCITATAVTRFYFVVALFTFSELDGILKFSSSSLSLR